MERGTSNYQAITNHYSNYYACHSLMSLVSSQHLHFIPQQLQTSLVLSEADYLQMLILLTFCELHFCSLGRHLRLVMLIHTVGYSTLQQSRTTQIRTYRRCSGICEALVRDLPPPSIEEGRRLHTVGQSICSLNITNGLTTNTHILLIWSITADNYV